ncbi:Heat shock protein 70 (Hsp 70) family protein isoform 1 [Hibiscus syriacus]|uniref:Heat shock protein 70 (Hsp 70) family protein isoform 1 n=1 Tax=Hibiscus syriacus TaxID=106335 RepID=A0A6A2YGM6_HIBSY|nr:Heat shock protein 70 (Hsp 70) family protein isoform 1 [Hibiscus syriacus]
MPGLNQDEFYPAMPIQSFRAEPPTSNGQNVHEHKSAGSSSIKKKMKKRKVFEFAFTTVTDFNPGISLSERDDGNRELVENVLWRFDALRTKLSQMEDNDEPQYGIIKHSVLKDSNIMMSKGERTNARKRIGVVHGERVAVSIISSEGYDDDVEDPDVLVYTGHGRNASGDKEVSDHKLVRGNLALERSLHRANEVRVIRGL